MKTYAEKLEEIETAIDAVQNRGQSYSIAGRTFTRANIASLYQERKRLEKLAAREARGGIKTQYGTPVS